MFARRPRLFVLLVSGCLVGLVWGCVAGLVIGKVPGDQASNLQEKPVRIMTITVEPTQQTELFAKLQKFANMWAYATRIAPIDINGEIYGVQMWRYDMKLSGSYSTISGNLKLEFSNTDPASPNPWWFFDSEIRDLRTFIYEIPNATFSVRK